MGRLSNRSTVIGEWLVLALGLSLIFVFVVTS